VKNRNLFEQGESANPPLGGRRFLSANQLMAVLGYADRAAFWAAVRAAGIPHVRINARRILFDEQAVASWLEKHSCGSQS
jgi:predicted DNA-binding transcriptional regulator AlpA